MAKLAAYLTLQNASKALEFYQEAFDAKVVDKFDAPDGRIVHSVLRIQDTTLYLADDWHKENLVPPTGTHLSLLLEVEDSAAMHDALVAMGATSLHAPKDMFWGACWSQVQDPFGVVWGFNAQVREPTAADMGEGFQKWYAEFV